MKKTAFILIAILFLQIPKLKSQNLNIPLQKDFQTKIEYELVKSSSAYFTSFLPYNQHFIKQIHADSILHFQHNDFVDSRRKPNIWKKFASENLVDISNNDFRFIINPLFHFSEDYDLKNNQKLGTNWFSVNTRGVEAKGNLGSKFSFYTYFYENQAFFVDYLNQFSNQYLVVPGQGTRKNFQTNGHDYAISGGYLSFSPADFVNLQLGQGKNFIGNGYRSLLLSDNAIVYPYFKAHFQFKKWQYISLFTQHQAHYTNYLDYRYRWGGSFQYLSFLPHKNIEISVFEGLISHISDSTSLTKYNFNYFNPIIFSRTLQYGFDDENNILLGLNLKINFLKKIQFYSQFMLDNLKKQSKTKIPSNSWAMQLGWKCFNVFDFIKNLDNHRLYTQFEYNSVSPYSYQSYHAWQNYSHLNQPLAHPLGANFNEWLGILEYQFQSLALKIMYSRATKGLNFNDLNYGSDIFVATEIFNFDENPFSGEITQGLKTIIENKMAKISFLLNPNTNFQVFAEYRFRKFQNSEISTKTNFISFGIKTDLQTIYSDF